MYAALTALIKANPRLILYCILLHLAACAEAQVPGCTDPLAINFNASATVNDGSCQYSSATVTPQLINNLSDTVAETSGIVFMAGSLWTQNDDGDTNLYVIDTFGNIAQSVPVAGVVNTDWEEVTQDSGFIYIGDFGNNANGNRTDLRILRIEKTSLNVDTIKFVYPDQTDLSGTGNNNTDFDCEAFIVTDDSIYLFTKQWVSGRTKLYRLPKMASGPGTETALLQDSFDVQGLVTGASYVREKRTLVLLGYSTGGSSILSPFAVLLYDYRGNQFFSGNKRKIAIAAPLHQMEGIASMDGISYFLTNERLTAGPFSIPPSLQKVDFGPFLGHYYQTDAGQASGSYLISAVFPNPACRQILVKVSELGDNRIKLILSDMQGRKVRVWDRLVRGRKGIYELDLTGIPGGSYHLEIAVPGKGAVRHLLTLGGG